RRGARAGRRSRTNRGDRPGARAGTRARARARARRGADPRWPQRPRRQGPRRGARPALKTLVIYLMADPDTPELARAAVDGGADFLEVGFPFSDPLADGPVIRRAGERALARGMRTRRCLDVLARTRELAPDTPLIPMTYSS